MQINKRFFPEILKDNETAYFAHLVAIIESVDELSCLEITKNPNTYHFRLVPSVLRYNDMLLEELFKFHNLFNIKMDLSKSIKTSGTIVFDIWIE